MTKILCATDGTEVSLKAELWAGRLSNQLGCHLTYVYVSGVSPEDITSTVGDMVVTDVVDAKNSMVLKHCNEVIEQNNFRNSKCLILNKHPIAESIVEYAEKEGFDLIVTGTKGHLGGIANLFLGSVASEVIHRAHCAVTVVR